MSIPVINTLTNQFLSLTTTLLPPLHLLFYSTLLGAELYQTFVMTKVCYTALPKSAFTTLQKRVFPLYFQGQSLLLFLAAATCPPYGLVSVARHKTHWIPFAVAGVTAVLNLVVYEPRTRRAMVDRVHQESRDGRRAGGDGRDENSSASPEMQVLNRVFSKNHAMCIHLNLISVGAMLVYGWALACRLQV
ncbi:hypothetical protein B0T22DRAFT_539791 [Podospora appendiculata]|uniref:TMEM205-like domain-containing protein n=1 Tax=Podospora appendiculata TaxID=314037 RepID=A0AAE0X1R6_9PEZI|nr:hypothetical protein B0T22DRAFT_539791 [Podospora appendiculata]